MPPERESIQEAGAALAADNNAKINNWVKDGTAKAEPETVETPVTEQPRDPATGKFLTKDPVEAAVTGATDTPPKGSAPASPAPTAPAAPAAGASAAEVQEFIDAQLADGSTFKVPKGIRLPSKRGAETVYEPLDVVLKERMLERDYRLKTDELGRSKREFEADNTRFKAEAAKVAAREQWLKEREAEMIEAQKDPDKWAAWVELQEAYKTNPRIRQMVDDALAKRETDAAIAVYEERDFEDATRRGVEQAESWLAELSRAPEFAGVNPERVRVRFAQALQSGQAVLDPAVLRDLFAAEARYLGESQGPLQSELANLKAKVADLESAAAAGKHNANTAHALNRGKAPPVAVTGRPPAPVDPPAQGRFTQRELAARNQQWANQR